jgi:hypothetical protein
LAFKVLLQRRKELHFKFSASDQGCMWDVPGFSGCEIISEGNLFSDSDYSIEQPLTASQKIRTNTKERSLFSDLHIISSFVAV